MNKTNKIEQKELTSEEKANAIVEDIKNDMVKFGFGEKFEEYPDFHKNNILNGWKNIVLTYL